MPPLNLKHIMGNALLSGIFKHLAIHCQRFKAAFVLLLKELIFSSEYCYLISKQRILLSICIVLMRSQSQIIMQFLMFDRQLSMHSMNLINLILKP